ncbi:AzlD domain-containing protein [Vibrio sp. SCSIO 43137]|uniref:AzlD domain-containing protein n=1 Tax=Vibrio sp. SCSIO 43137 TaxID=3021011 RepID=UPI0023071C75|nr:AzlD domain-containing protein [Vibrio sp. SCSIO 43137]WCE31533.1 AzlD domain-containing protein [Vibrio sp. SCSIO 43137]
MILLSIFAMAALVFISRYLFLEPRLPVRLNNKAQRLLIYSSPAVLTSILAPIVFVHDDELAVSADNPYLIGAVVAALLVWKTKNVLWTTIISMAVFLLFKMVIFV